MLLCSRHHTLVHQQGFRLTLHPDRRLEVITADTLPATHCDGRMDYRYVVSVLVQQAA